MKKHPVGEADTLRIMMRDAGMDPKAGASEEDLGKLGFSPVGEKEGTWQAEGLTVFLNDDGKLEDVGDR